MKLSSVSKFSALSGALAAAMTFIVVVIGGYLEPNYSHRLNLISELNAVGSKYPQLMGYLGFIPIGVVTLLFIWRLKDVLVVSRRVIFGLGFIALAGTDSIVTALAPCDAGCPVSGNISLSQQIHLLSGLLTTLFVPIGIFLLIRPFKQAGFSKAVTVTAFAAMGVNLLCFLLLVSSAVSENVGLVQRIGVGILYLYFALLSIEIYKKFTGTGDRVLIDRKAALNRTPEPHL